MVDGGAVSRARSPKPIGRQLGITHGVLDVAMAEIGLQGAGVIGIRVTAAVRLRGVVTRSFDFPV
jgi:hypothetical protein